MTQTPKSTPFDKDNPTGESRDSPVEITPLPRGFRYQDIIGLWPDLDEDFEDYVKEQRRDRRQRELL